MLASCQMDSRGSELSGKQRYRAVRAATITNSRRIHGGNSGCRMPGEQGHMLREFAAGFGQACPGLTAAVTGPRVIATPAAPDLTPRCKHCQHSSL